jgi:hypothetical protein
MTSSKNLKMFAIPMSVVVILSSGTAIASPKNDLNLNTLPEQLLEIVNPSRPATVVTDDTQTTGESTTTTTTTTTSEDEPPTVVVDDGSETETTTTQEPRFTCQYINGQYTVMYNPESRPGQAYPWAVPGQLGGGWTPERRCIEIARRLESYRPDGLIELGTGVENNYNTVCVLTERVPGCRIVFTVPPGQDPVVTRNRVFQNLVVADSGENTQGVVTFTGNDGQVVNQIEQILNIDLGGLGSGQKPSSSSPSSVTSNGIDLRPFLDPQDGGTGRLLENNTGTPASSPRLNPDSFR